MPWMALVEAVRLCGVLVLWAAFVMSQSGCGESQPEETPSGTPRRDGGTGARAVGGAGAGGKDRDASVRAPSSDAGQLTPTPPALIPEPEDAAAYIFDQDALRTYELRLAPADLARIDANPAGEEYVAGMMHFEGREYGPVGIRYKGSVGAFRGCLTTAMPGTKACTKLSMKVSFHWKDPEGRFYGLRKLQFHAMNRDPSMLKERLGYALFRESRIAAPRAVHARLVINGELVGLFALVEQIDGRFTRSRFREGGEGNLYKEAWPLDARGMPTMEAVLRATLKTNEDDNPSLQTMLDLGRELAQADADQRPEVLAKYTDLDYGMRYVAVDRAIAHDDGPFHWYCFGLACFNHNFYWYEELRSNRLWLIAWDLDSSFNLNNTTTTLWFDWDDTSRGCQAQTRAPYVAPLRAPTCDPLTHAWAQLQEQYLDQTAAFLDGPFETARVEAKLAAWELQIAPVVEEAGVLHDDAVQPDAWRKAADALRVAIATLRSRAQERVARGPIAIADPWLAQAMDAGTVTPRTPASAMDADGGEDLADPGN